MTQRSNPFAVILAFSICLTQSLVTLPALAQTANPATTSAPNAGVQSANPASGVQTPTQVLAQTPAETPQKSSESHHNKKDEMSDYQRRHNEEGYYGKERPKQDEYSDYQHRHEDEGYYSEIKPYSPPPPEAKPAPEPLSQPIKSELPPLAIPPVQGSKPGDRRFDDDTGSTGSVIATRHSKSAEEDFQAGRFPQAIGHFRASLDAFPNQPELYPHYWEACTKNNDWSEAKVALEKWFALQPEKKKEYSWALGETLFQLRDYEKATAALNDALKYGVKLDEIHHLLLQIALVQRNNAEATNQYIALLKIKPSDYQTQLAFANMLELQGKHLDALSHYKAAVNLQPSDGALAARVAYMLMYYNKDYNSAINYYKKAMNADPANAAQYQQNIRFAESQMPKPEAKKVQQ